jgi:hypothetical protein
VYRSDCPGSLYGKDDHLCVRLSTYFDWPKNHVINFVEMAKSGFFYTGEDDIVGCPYCNNFINGWKEEMTPLNIHKIYSDCDFIKNIKDHKVKIKNKLIKPPLYVTESSINQILDEHDRAVDTLLCKICLLDKIDTVSISCGHVTCSTCAAKLNICAICKSTIGSMRRIYL